MTYHYNRQGHILHECESMKLMRWDDDHFEIMKSEYPKNKWILRKPWDGITIWDAPHCILCGVNLNEDFAKTTEIQSFVDYQKEKTEDWRARHE